MPQPLRTSPTTAPWWWRSRSAIALEGAVVSAHPGHRPAELRPGIRMDARLDPTTRTKVDELAHHFHRPRAAVLCHIMHWSLSQGRIGAIHHSDARSPVRHLYLLC
jgi:hypothetical protein